MTKYLCWGSMGVSGLLLVLFVMDLVIQKPFDKLDQTVDIVGAICCAILGYLSWEAHRDMR